MKLQNYFTCNTSPEFKKIIAATVAVLTPLMKHEMTNDECRLTNGGIASLSHF
ncbi:hypothetical protein D1AOALGA4SA_4305 [Olavius algarvensis Delta 1 endosymbiont]|nr:hypothetical protein D1AOALGA4SA_4305 [Olavius algarvensis Delta 1 endosymbiont]